jgi:hypothetical protein
MIGLFSYQASAIVFIFAQMINEHNSAYGQTYTNTDDEQYVWEFFHIICFLSVNRFGGYTIKRLQS